VRRTGSYRDVELDLPRANRTGEPLGVRVRVVPLRGATYSDGHVAVEANDVTEAHRVARVRRDFVANVSHELKTPVGALILLAETLVEAADDPEAARRFAERIQHESQRLARLVKELLELSRLQGAEPLPAFTPVAVDRIVAEVVDRARTAATAKGIAVKVAGRRGLTVYGTESQLITAVANLVENAIAYSGDGTTVQVSRQRIGDQVAIRVTDQGIGIAAADLDRIFERFYRTDQARSRDTGGTGLGLAIVRHIAVNHSGRVEVTSTPGRGSTFTLWLPARSPGDMPALTRGVEIEPDGKG
jgi:two-component system sensor histidine kinase SenX3